MSLAEQLIEEAEALEEIAVEYGDCPRGTVYFELARDLRWDAEECA